MFGLFRKKKKAAVPEKSTAASKPAAGLTERLIVSMVASGMTYAEICDAFPDLNEQTLKAVIKKSLARVGMFLDY